MSWLKVVLSGLILCTTIACTPPSGPVELPNLDSPPESVASSIPDFSQIADTEQKKRQFADFINQVAQPELAFIKQQRKAVSFLYLKNRTGTDLTTEALVWLAELKTLYRIEAEVDSPEFWQDAMSKVDVVPMSLIIAQAAIESAWGTSRFATQANNLFGQWCYQPGCGVVPLQRPENETYEVAKFDNVNLAVRAYLLNLNRTKAYQPLRQIRAQSKLEDQDSTGIKLAEALPEDYTNKSVLIKYLIK